jgi:hypothetical protein
LAWTCRPRFTGRPFALNRPNFEALGLDRILEAGGVGA